MRTAAATSIGASLQALAARSPEPVHAVAPRRAATPRTVENVPSMRLTSRQMEVLTLLCEGLPNKTISRELDIAPGTVKVHIGCILRELGVTSRLQAVVVARRRGLVGDAGAGSQAEMATTLAGVPGVAAARPASDGGYRAAVAF